MKNKPLTMIGQAQRITELEADNARLRTALEDTTCECIPGAGGIVSRCDRCRTLSATVEHEHPDGDISDLQVCDPAWVDAACAEHPDTVRHPQDCHKVEHVGTGYLHPYDDDGPYDVDGVTYCGRCHRYIAALKELEGRDG